MKIDFEKIIYLSYNVDENSPRELPIDPVRIYDTATIEADGYFESRVDLSGHCATHIDVPCLMYADGFTVAEIPQEKLFGNTVLIDLSDSKCRFQLYWGTRTLQDPPRLPRCQRP